MNETLKLIDQRMSLRRYAPQAIRPEDVDAILESAMRAPTAMNMMLYSIVEVADPAKKEKLAET
ncbi:nitroreductase family protein, partial [Candidatus Bipolaricaulota bacterium]